MNQDKNLAVLNLLTVDELAEKLRVPKSFIYARSREKGSNAMPMKKIGKYCRFQLQDVMAWFEKQQEQNAK